MILFTAGENIDCGDTVSLNAKTGLLMKSSPVIKEMPQFYSKENIKKKLQPKSFGSYIKLDYKKNKITTGFFSGYSNKNEKPISELEMFEILESFPKKPK